MPCFIHTLQFAVEVVLKLPEVSHALARCRHLVAHFNHSVNLFIEEKNRWISDVSTRWNSAYYMAGSHYVLPYWNYTKVCAFTNLRELANLAI